MVKKELPKGFTCTCGRKHKFPMYVYAHWTIELLLICGECGKKWSFLEGEVEEVGDE